MRTTIGAFVTGVVATGILGFFLQVLLAAYVAAAPPSRIRPPALRPLPLPDLRITELQGNCDPGRAGAGLTIKNLTGVATKASFRTSARAVLTVRKPGKIPAVKSTSVSLGSRTTSSGFTGEEKFTLQKNIGLPSSLQGFNVIKIVLHATVDDGRTVPEKNENNNKRSLVCFQQ